MGKQVEISEKLQKARDYEQKELAQRNMVEKQSFHVCAPVGWINDPNGFSEFKGEKHLFFQYHPYDTNWGPMHWGHVKTSDFIRWEQLPVALAPDETYDGFGCFSGSAIEWKGMHVIAYTGVESTKENGKQIEYQRQCIALGDGTNYQKMTTNPVITDELIPAGGSKLDFRDPKIWADGEVVNMVVGNRAEDGSGQILLYRSCDLEHWDFVSVLDQSQNRYGKMWECPDFFTIEGTDVLIVSPQEMQAVDDDLHAGDGTLFILGSYDKLSAGFEEKQVRAVDMGLDFYAPQTMQCSDGRHIMIAWLQSWSASWFTKEDGFCGMMTIPRELKMNHGVLCQLPVHELTNYYTNRYVLDHIEVSSKRVNCERLSGREQNLDLTLEGDGDYLFELRVAENEQYYTSIQYDSKQQVLIFDRSHSGVRRDVAHFRRMHVQGDHEQLKLRVLMDRYSIELFVNDGEQAMTSVIRTPYDAAGVSMYAEGKVVVSVEKNEIDCKQ